MTTPWSGTTISAGQVVTIYDIDALREFVQQTVDNFESIESDNNIEYIDIPEPPFDQI